MTYCTALNRYEYEVTVPNIRFKLFQDTDFHDWLEEHDVAYKFMGRHHALSDNDAAPDCIVSAVYQVDLTRTFYFNDPHVATLFKLRFL